LDDCELLRFKLSEFVKDGQLNQDLIADLLASMRKHTKPVTPARLGTIGADHLKVRLLRMGIKPESFRYCKIISPKKVKKGDSVQSEKPRFDDLPSILETAFGYLDKSPASRRRIYTGANWSAAIKNPFRSFGQTGEGLETMLSDRRATRHEPIVYVCHLAQPRISYTDRGKSALIMEDGQ
jgi:hypothetical protein